MESIYRESKPQLQVLSWEDVMKLSSNVAKSIISSSIRFDSIIGIARGGIIPARIISDLILVRDFYVYTIRLYSGINERDEIRVIQRPDGSFKDKKVLIIDDIIDTGKTISFVKNEVSREALDVKTASLFKKPWSEFQPDFCGAVTDKWIVFPWELTETRVQIEGENGKENDK